LFLNKEDNGEACARLARRHAERRDIPHIEASSNLGRKTHVVVDLKHHVALRMRRLQKTEKKEEEIFHVPGNTFHREIDAGHDARKKETESASSSSSS
jgi:hypothetical protein